MFFEKNGTYKVKAFSERGESSVKTAEERLACLHKKMDGRRRLRERRRTGAIGACSAALALCLFVCVFVGGAHNGGAAGIYSGSTMLFEGSGGYVLVAVIAFMLGAAIAILLIRQRGRNARKEEEKEEQNETGSENNKQKGDQK